MSMQPFGHRLFRGIFANHRPFVAKTVMVKDNDPEAAMRLLNKRMAAEGLFSIIRRTQRFEKPYKQRNRLAYERCKAIYDEDMQRRILFVARKSRQDPYPGQY